MVKGKDITILNLKKKQHFICDYFIICSGQSTNKVHAIFKYVKNIIIKKCHKNPCHVEGVENKQWILIDYITIVVHIFQEKIRLYYNLEHLWEQNTNLD